MAQDDFPAEATDKIGQLYGLDTDRIFANQIQMFVNGTVSLFVLREVVGMEASEEIKHSVGRNVASFILPTDVAKSLKDIMVGVFDRMEGDQTPPSEPAKAKKK